MKKIAIIALGALALGGCAASPIGGDSVRPDPVVANAPFDPAAAAFIKKPGNGVIKGQAFLKKPDGVVKLAGGEVVRLVPVTAYSRNRFTQLYRGRKFVAANDIPKIQPDPAYVDYTRTVKASSTGRFVFENVAPGSYYVATQNIWRKEGSMLSEGGAFFETVTVSGKEDGPIDLVVNGQ